MKRIIQTIMTALAVATVAAIMATPPHAQEADPCKAADVGTRYSVSWRACASARAAAMSEHLRATSAPTRATVAPKIVPLTKR